MNMFTNYRLLILLLLGVLSSCKSDDDSIVNSFNSISDIATFHGNLDSNTVIINVQGGPSPELDDGAIITNITKSQTQSALHVNIHQVQTLNPNLFSGSQITSEQATAFHIQNVKILKRVIDFFKQKGKTIYMKGSSFGGFLIQELIATHGINIVDGYAIFVARLDIEEETWKAFSQGNYMKYIYDNDGNFTIEIEKDENNPVRKNMGVLAAGLGHNRYTEKLSNIKDLSKITYVYGNRDKSVGPLSAKELNFLNSKGASVILVEGGNHTVTSEKGVSMLKEIFNIP